MGDRWLLILFLVLSNSCTSDLNRFAVLKAGLDGTKTSDGKQVTRYEAADQGSAQGTHMSENFHATKTTAGGSYQRVVGPFPGITAPTSPAASENYWMGVGLHANPQLNQ